MSYAYIAPPNKNGKRLVHKELRCKDMPHPDECRTAYLAPDKEKTLANAKSQASSDAEHVELCKKCWP